jgi:transposase
MSDSLPVFIQTLSGNTSDKNHFREMVKEYGPSLQEKWGEDKIWVWDSAVYSEKNLGEISEDYSWITRVPETLSEAKEVLENSLLLQTSWTARISVMKKHLFPKE